MLGLEQTQQRSHFFCNLQLCAKARGCKPRRVKNFHLCFQAFSMKCVHHGNDVKVTGEDDFLSSNNTIKADNKIVKERFWTGSVTSKIETWPFDTDTDAQLHDERTITS